MFGPVSMPQSTNAQHNHVSSSAVRGIGGATSFQQTLIFTLPVLLHSNQTGIRYSVTDVPCTEVEYADRSCLIQRSRLKVRTLS